MRVESKLQPLHSRIFIDSSILFKAERSLAADKKLPSQPFHSETVNTIIEKKNIHLIPIYDAYLLLQTDSNQIQSE